MASKLGRQVYRTAAWRQARRAALERDGFRCRDCGRAGRLEVHHVFPIVHSPDWFRLSNLVSLCRPCHFRRHGAVMGALPTPETRRQRRALKAWALNG